MTRSYGLIDAGIAFTPTYGMQRYVGVNRQEMALGRSEYDPLRFRRNRLATSEAASALMGRYLRVYPTPYDAHIRAREKLVQKKLSKAAQELAAFELSILNARKSIVQFYTDLEPFAVVTLEEK
jgi:hypothetical protein